MCGIVGYIGKNKALPIVLDGLKSLEYRGYDSAGIAYIYNEQVQMIKEVGRIKALEKLLDLDLATNISIGHTRWATHGAPSVVNSHPHRSGKFTVVHNGIIENYVELKEFLQKEGVVFVSATDTEVIPALLNYFYAQEKDIVKCLHQTLEKLEGSFALGIICDDDLNHLYAVRRGSPLIIAQNKDGVFIASDVPAILNYTKKYYLLEKDEIAKLSRDNIEIYDTNLKSITKQALTYEGSMEDAQLNGYEHYMLKEIFEEEKVYLDTLNYYVQNNDFNENMPNFKKYQNIHIVACGSAYYVGKIGKYLLEQYANIPTTVEVASEYRYKKNFYGQNTLVIIISQSGETADSLEALRLAKKDGIDTLAIVNVYMSSIAREAKYVLYVKAGPEIAVATTKVFLAQTTMMALLTVKLANQKELLKEFLGLEKYIKDLLTRDYLEYAKEIVQANNTFFIGRLMDYALCLEGSLKIKETSYINSVAFEAGELKHGTISLIEKNTPVIGICTNSYIAPKTISNLKEVKARGAKIIYITNEAPEDNFYDKMLLIPKVHDLVNPIILVIPLQLIAYNVAKLKGCDIDKPRNLAKSVTVE